MNIYTELIPIVGIKLHTEYRRSALSFDDILHRGDAVAKTRLNQNKPIAL